MKQSPMIALAAAALIGGACGGDATEPATVVADDITYSAAVQQIVAPWGQFAVTVKLKNTKNAAVTRSYSTGCPVRIRLYRPLDNRLVYDETKRECGSTSATPLELASGAEVTFTTGTRDPKLIAGDSLEFTYYNVMAVVQPIGGAEAEVSAGGYKLLYCVQPALNAPPVCT